MVNLRKRKAAVSNLESRKRPVGGSAVKAAAGECATCVDVVSALMKCLRFTEYVQGRHDTLSKAARQHCVDESSVRYHVTKWKGTAFEEVLKASKDEPAKDDEPGDGDDAPTPCKSSSSKCLVPTRRSATPTSTYKDAVKQGVTLIRSGITYAPHHCLISIASRCAHAQGSLFSVCAQPHKRACAPNNAHMAVLLRATVA